MLPPLGDRPQPARAAQSWLFVASQAVVFTCLGLLQTASERYALPLLVMMHVGIALFISTQRSLRRVCPDVRRLVRATHVLMVLYLSLIHISEPTRPY